MRKQKTILLSIISATFLFNGCQKDEPPKEQDVVFAATQVDPNGGLKSASDWDCKDLIADYAKVNINNVDYLPKVFRLDDGKLYTQAIKLPVLQTPYTVSNFLLMDDNNTPLTTDDDIIVMATPTLNSDYDEYVLSPVSFTINVTEFTKAEIPIEVLCFQDNQYQKFGFDWFVITEIVVREQCFFGDFCVKHPADYEGSNYENQSTGLHIDMPALFEIRAYDEDGIQLPNSPFTNASEQAGWGVGSPLCVQYPDNLGIDGEVYAFELWIYVKTGSGFEYVHFHTWSFTDNDPIVSGSDNVVDFVLGSCNYSGTDLQLAPYQNLPTTANVDFSYPGTPGYWGILINSTIPVTSDPLTGFDLPVGLNMTGWCGDPNHSMTPGNYNVNVYSSLNSSNWPAGMPFNLGKIAQVNWLFNNLADFSINELALTDSEGDIIQAAVWNIVSSIPTTGMSLDMAMAASNHADFIPLPGGWAAVLMVADNQPLRYQLIFTVVDP